MDRTIVIQVAIIVAVLLVVLSLAITAYTSYSGENLINQNNSSRALTLDLQRGQTVSGFLNYTGDDTGTWFVIRDPNFEPIIHNPIHYDYENHSVIFSFTAFIDGDYFFSIANQNPFGDRISYSYTISSAFLGFGFTVWIVFAIAIGVVLELLETLRGFYQKRRAS